MNNHHFTYPPNTEEPETIPFDRWKARDQIYAECEEKGYRRGFNKGLAIGLCIGCFLTAATEAVGLLILFHLVR